MSVRLERHAIAPGVRRRVSVDCADYQGFDGQREPEYGYSVTGAKLRAGSLRTSRWTVDEAWERAVRCFREHNPKARLVVTYCRECGTGTKPDAPCKHPVS